MPIMSSMKRFIKLWWQLSLLLWAVCSTGLIVQFAFWHFKYGFLATWVLPVMVLVAVLGFLASLFGYRKYVNKAP